MGNPVFYLATQRKERQWYSDVLGYVKNKTKKKKEKQSPALGEKEKHLYLSIGIFRHKLFPVSDTSWGEGRGNESRRVQSASVPQSSAPGSSFLAQDGAARDTFLALGGRRGCFRKAQTFGASDPASSLSLRLRPAVAVTPVRCVRKRSNIPGVLPRA